MHLKFATVHFSRLDLLRSPSMMQAGRRWDHLCPGQIHLLMDSNVCLTNVCVTNACVTHVITIRMQIHKVMNTYSKNEGNNNYENESLKISAIVLS